MSRAKAAEEVREEFLDQIRKYVEYWATDKTKDRSTRDRLEALAFSIFNILDGTSAGLPAMDLVLRPHQDDTLFYQGEEENWYKDGQVINADVMLHDAWYEKKTR